jgi:hypothetical protein|tara:strand:+ start:367 stop:570 length:204 start_codon:yes stop_codon:yes gene_type:complete
MDIDRVIKIVRESTTLAGGGATGAKPGFSSKSDNKGPIAGYDTPLQKKKKKYAYLGPRSRKTWMSNG